MSGFDVSPASVFGVSGLMQHFSREQREMVRHIPRTRLLLERDAPYFPMNPGVKIQTPLGIGDVGWLVAAERKESFRDLMRSTALNAKRLYSGCGPALVRVRSGSVNMKFPELVMFVFPIVLSLRRNSS